MKFKVSSMLTIVLCVAALSITSFYSGYATAATMDSEIQYNSQGKIVFDNGTEDVVDDVIFDATDFYTIGNMITEGKTNIKDELNKYEGININEDIPAFNALADAIDRISDDTDATADHILYGKKVLVGKNIVTGSMNDHSGGNISADNIKENGTNAEITIPGGYYDEDSKISIPIETIIQNVPTINSNLGHIYYLGSYSGTVDVAQKMPNLYTKLTVDNFIVMPGRIGWAQGKAEQYSGSGVWKVEYNSSTGTLTFHSSYNPNGHGSAYTEEHKVYIVTGNIENV